MVITEVCMILRALLHFIFAFAATDGPLGKKLNNTRTRREVGWEPKYPSFADFLSSMWPIPNCIFAVGSLKCGKKKE